MGKFSEYPGIIGKFLGIIITEIRNIRSARDNNDGFDNETLEEAMANCNDMGVEIVISISSAHSRRSSCSSRDYEAAGYHANKEASLGCCLAANDDTQLQTNSLMSVLKAPKASSVSRKRI